MSRAGTLEGELRSALEGEVRFDEMTRRIYSSDASMYSIEPVGVAYPRGVDDIAAAVRLAAEHEVSLLPRGAATSLAGQTVGHSLILDCSRHMNRIIEVDPDAMTARVEPGVVQAQLNRHVAGQGLIFGPDTSTASRATIGGMIGNNSGGSHSVVYGMTIDHVRELGVVLSDGSEATFGYVDAQAVQSRAGAATLEGAIYREVPKLVHRYADAIATGYPAHWRRSGGYRLDRLGTDGSLDLAALVTGSEGTLVVVSEATVRLVPKPRHTVIAVGHFTSTPAAIAATEDALSCSPMAVELMDETIIGLALRQRELAGIATVLEGNPSALLFVSFTGDTVAEAEASLGRLTALWSSHHHGYATLKAVTPAEQAPLLRVRSSALGLLMAASVGPRRPLAFVEDTAVDPKFLVEYTERFRELLERRGVQAGFYGHCSVGCLHIRPFIDLSRPDEIATMRSLSEEVLELNLEYGGSNSSEHGDGLARTEFNRRIFGDELYEAMRELKKIFDPANRMNPGKIVDGPSMTEDLRDRDFVERESTWSRVRFSQGSMFAAADRCMRIGACRKSGEGTMCPSYMATMDEEHSTRGRASALVLALSSPDPVAALGDERLHEVLDLCLECKACKSECPLSVDMSLLKSETLSHYYDAHGTPLSVRAFAKVRELNRMGSRVAPIANTLFRLAPVRVALERVLGIDRRRPLPRLARQSLPAWFAKQPPAERSSTGTKSTRVIVLADSFTSYSEPEIGQAAVRLLLRAGYDVELESTVCCGRAELSKGLLDGARAKAKQLAERLGDAAKSGARIVGWEPACILTLSDDHLALLPEDERIAVIGRQTSLVDDLLLDAIDQGRLIIPEGSPVSGRRILFHGHCHQKALVGTSTTVRLLKAIPGAEVAELDAGCCGMAGSFGMEQNHYELSMQIGGLRLFPAVNAEPPSTIISATGSSCRQQVLHGTGRRAAHPLEILEDAFDDDFRR